MGGVDKLEKVFDIVSKFRNDNTRTFFFLKSDLRSRVEKFFFNVRNGL